MDCAGVWAALRRSILYANRFTSLQCIMAQCLADWVTRAGPPLFVQSSLRFTPLVLAMMRSEFINSGLPLYEGTTVYETKNKLVLFFIPNQLPRQGLPWLRGRRRGCNQSFRIFTITQAVVILWVLHSWLFYTLPVNPPRPNTNYLLSISRCPLPPTHTPSLSQSREGERKLQ